MSARTPLEVIQVVEPCPASWDRMQGDDRARFCRHCNKTVHNLSAMTRDEAERLACEQAGGLCVLMERDRAGTVITLDYEPPHPHGRWFGRRDRWSVWRLVGLLAVLGSVLGWVTWQSNQPKVLGRWQCPNTSN